MESGKNYAICGGMAGPMGTCIKCCQPTGTGGYCTRMIEIVVSDSTVPTPPAPDTEEAQN